MLRSLCWIFQVFSFFGSDSFPTRRTIATMHWRYTSCNCSNYSVLTDGGLWLPSVPDEISPSAGPCARERALACFPKRWTSGQEEARRRPRALMGKLSGDLSEKAPWEGTRVLFLLRSKGIGQPAAVSRTNNRLVINFSAIIFT